MLIDNDWVEQYIDAACDKTIVNFYRTPSELVTGDALLRTTLMPIVPAPHKETVTVAANFDFDMAMKLMTPKQQMFLLPNGHYRRYVSRPRLALDIENICL